MLTLQLAKLHTEFRHKMFGIRATKLTRVKTFESNPNAFVLRLRDDNGRIYTISMVNADKWEVVK